jgi:hypothetical protein
MVVDKALDHDRSMTTAASGAAAMRHRGLGPPRRGAMRLRRTQQVFPMILTLAGPDRERYIAPQ